MMNPSPLRTLVARHTCLCRASINPRSSSHAAPAVAAAATRLLSTTSRHRAPFSAPITNSVAGSAEDLRRRYNLNQTQTQTPAGGSSSNVSAKDDAERARLVKRMRYATLGFIGCAVGIAGSIWMFDDEKKMGKRDGEMKFDAPPPPNVPGLVDTSLAEETDRIPTGTSTIPWFPRVVRLAAAPNASRGDLASDATGKEGDVEYQLLGLGVRTVSIFSIQVYVVGMYVAVPDIATLQERLIRTIDDVATTLVPGEKDKLRDMLLDPVRGEEVWNMILKDGGIRTAWRIVPTRNTDFMHMRDGFVRGITARAGKGEGEERFEDEAFGASLNEFKSVFGGGQRKKIPKGETLWLVRDKKGGFGAMMEERGQGGEGGDEKGEGMWQMGKVNDERVGRLLWLNYLAGKSVSSEEARKSVVEGCVEIVSRPVGTVAAQVV